MSDHIILAKIKLYAAIKRLEQPTLLETGVSESLSSTGIGSRQSCGCVAFKMRDSTSYI